MKPMVAPLLVMAALLSSISAAPPSDTPQSQAVVAKPFRVIFNAYDGDPKKPEAMSFQINTLDLRQPSEFLKIGDVIPRTELKLGGFKYIEKPNPKTGQNDDVSELTLVHVESGKETVLVLTRVTNITDGAK